MTRKDTYEAKMFILENTKKEDYTDYGQMKDTPAMRQFLADNGYIVRPELTDDDDDTNLIDSDIEVLIGFDDRNIGRTSHSYNSAPVLERIYKIGEKNGEYVDSIIRMWEILK